MTDEITKILDDVVVLLAHGSVKPEALQKVAKAVFDNSSTDVPSDADQAALNAILEKYYQNLGIHVSGGCTNCGPPGWHAMPSP